MVINILVIFDNDTKTTNDNNDTVGIIDLNRLNLVKLCSGVLVLDSNQFLILPNQLTQKMMLNSIVA